MCFQQSSLMNERSQENGFKNTTRDRVIADQEAREKARTIAQNLLKMGMPRTQICEALNITPPRLRPLGNNF